MDKEQAIEEMAQCENYYGYTCASDCRYKKACPRYILAQELYKKGYQKRNVVIKEFAERLIKNGEPHSDFWGNDTVISISKIKKFLKE